MMNLYIYFYLMMVMSIFFYLMGLFMYYLELSFLLEWLFFNFNSLNMEMVILKLNEFRLLDTDNRCVLPFNFPIRILTSSIDVICSWTIPSLGIKMDSTPERMNQSLLFMNRPGLFFGQCSEICGMNHSFMTICLESTNFFNFKNWLFNMS